MDMNVFMFKHSSVDLLHATTKNQHQKIYQCGFQVILIYADKTH